MFTRNTIFAVVSGVLLGSGLVSAAWYRDSRAYHKEREAERELDEIRALYFEYKNKIKALQDDQEPAPEKDEPKDEPKTDEVDEEIDEETDEDDGSAEWDPWGDGYYNPLIFRDGRYVIDEGNPRWDGPLNDKETEEYTSVLGEKEEVVESVVLTIKHERYNRSAAALDEPIYQITLTEHQDMPEFFDTKTLDYYEDDDILALGNELVPQIEHYIDPICLNHFGKHSGSGDPNVVWCRNEDHETDYEIVRQEDSYQHAVLGVPDGSGQSASRRFRVTEAEEAEETYVKRSKRTSR